MCLIDHDEISLWYLAPSQGLNGANLNRLIRIRKDVLALHNPDVGDPVAPEAIDRLRNK